MNDDDFFELANCSPSLDELRTKALMEQLVSDPDDGFNTFIMGMSEFIRLLVDLWILGVFLIFMFCLFS